MSRTVWLWVVASRRALLLIGFVVCSYFFLFTICSTIIQPNITIAIPNISFLPNCPEFVVKTIRACIAVAGSIDLVLSVSFPNKKLPPIQMSGKAYQSNGVENLKMPKPPNYTNENIFNVFVPSFKCILQIFSPSKFLCKSINDVDNWIQKTI